MNKILTAAVVVLLVLIAGEGVYYGVTHYSNKNQATNTPTSRPVKKPSLTEEELKALHDPYRSSFLPLELDVENDRIYIDKMSPQKVVNWVRGMGVNYAAWITLTTYKKNMVVSAYMDYTLKGKIKDLDFNKVQPNGKKYVYFGLVSETERVIPTWENEDAIAKTKFFQLVDGKETPMNMEELKNGDNITLEEKDDYTKAPNDPNFVVEAKIVKQ